MEEKISANELHGAIKAVNDSRSFLIRWVFFFFFRSKEEARAMLNERARSNSKRYNVAEIKKLKLKQKNTKRRKQRKKRRQESV